MSLFKAFTFSTAILVGTVTSALAHDMRRIEDIQARQRAAIEEGRWSGAITKREQRALLAEQERIDAMRRQAKADGRVTAREVREIRDAQNAARAHIAHLHSNRQVNIWRRWKTQRGL